MGKDELAFARIYDKLYASSYKKLYIAAGVFVLVILAICLYTVSSTGITGTYVIEPGASVFGTINRLDDERYVRFGTLAKVWAKVKGVKGVKAGSYIFEGNENLFEVVKRLEEGDFKQPLITITIPEGYTNQQIAKLLNEKLPNFDEQYFLALANVYEGFLFPETYKFLGSQTPEEVLRTMTSHFYDRYDDIATSTVILASVIEKEGKTPEDMKHIGGVLTKRLEEGMPLQVDASLSYYLPRSTYELTKEDLATDHPYNTYTRAGLPPGPIANPGDAALKAALDPKDNPYWFYVSDRQGIIYFARTLDEHNANVAKYVR